MKQGEGGGERRREGKTAKRREKRLEAADCRDRAIGSEPNGGLFGMTQIHDRIRRGKEEKERKERQ